MANRKRPGEPVTGQSNKKIKPQSNEVQTEGLYVEKIGNRRQFTVVDADKESSILKRFTLLDHSIEANVEKNQRVTAIGSTNSKSKSTTKGQWIKDFADRMKADGEKLMKELDSTKNELDRIKDSFEKDFLAFTATALTSFDANTGEALTCSLPSPQTAGKDRDLHIHTLRLAEESQVLLGHYRQLVLYRHTPTNLDAVSTKYMREQSGVVKSIAAARAVVHADVDELLVDKHHECHQTCSINEETRALATPVLSQVDDRYPGQEDEAEGWGKKAYKIQKVVNKMKRIYGQDQDPELRRWTSDRSAVNRR